MTFNDGTDAKQYAQCAGCLGFSEWLKRETSVALSLTATYGAWKFESKKHSDGWSLR